MPYFPISRHTDQYSSSKAQAEELFLKANGTELKRGGYLSVSVIRPAAIYGEGEERHFPRIVRHIDGGSFMFRIGRATVDWVHIDNLVKSLIVHEALCTCICF
jgi:nucleoside-diphosphate-sugar epimerase